MSLYWAAWILLGFGIPEGWALATHNYDKTLSETVWRWCDVIPGQTPLQYKFLHFLLLVFMVWLTGHMVFRLWR